MFRCANALWAALTTGPSIVSQCATALLDRSRQAQTTAKTVNEWTMCFCLMLSFLNSQSEVLTHRLRRIDNQLAILWRDLKFVMRQWTRSWAGVVGAVAVILRAVTRTGEFHLFLNLPSPNGNLPGLV